LRIVAISDIHSNLPALKAVLEDIKQFGSDVTLAVVGDFINCGPFPRETLETLRELNPVFVRGNHEDYVINQSKRSHEPVPPHRALRAPSRWTASQLTAEEINWLEDLPEVVRLPAPDGAEVVLAHGSPRRNDEGVSPEITQEKLAEIYAEEIQPNRLFIHGHTHRPTLIHWRDMVITNDGSVGIPVDNNPEACYLFAEWNGNNWRVEHHRVDYDRLPLIKAVNRNAQYDQSGPYMKLILENILNGHSCRIPLFVNKYIEGRTWEGLADDFEHLEQAVDHHLATYVPFPPR
jgi:predicted phosphodiesterase